MRWVGRICALCVASLAILGLTSTPASAHQPVVLEGTDTTPARGPLLTDGTVSFAVYGRVGKGTTQGFRTQLRDGDQLQIQLLIIDRAPANGLAASELPTVTVVAPDGRRTVMRPRERTPFFEPYSKREFIYLSRLEEPARAGTYPVTITGRSTTTVPFVIGVGYREVPGVVR